MEESNLYKRQRSNSSGNNSTTRRMSTGSTEANYRHSEKRAKSESDASHNSNRGSRSRTNSGDLKKEERGHRRRRSNNHRSKAYRRFKKKVHRNNNQPSTSQPESDGRPCAKAPENTTQFLIEQHSGDFSGYMLLENCRDNHHPKISGTSYDTPSSDHSSDIGDSSGSDDLQMKFQDEDFKTTWNKVHLDDLDSKSKLRLISDYIQLEERLRMKEDELREISKENLDIQKRCERLETERLNLSTENNKLKCSADWLQQRYQLNDSSHRSTSPKATPPHSYSPGYSPSYGVSPNYSLSPAYVVAMSPHTALSHNSSPLGLSPGQWQSPSYSPSQ